jgi:hypothetical protein
MPRRTSSSRWASLQVKNVPERIHRQIRAYAKRRSRTVSEVVLEAVMREIERDAFRTRLEKRAPADLGRPAARTLGEVSDERSRDLDEWDRQLERDAEAGKLDLLADEAIRDHRARKTMEI